MKKLDWYYGEMIMEDDYDIKEWSDDMETMGRICDQTFDYVWDIKGRRIILTDRCYSDGFLYEPHVQERIKYGTVVLRFNSFKKLFEYFFPLLSNQEQIDWVKQRLKIAN